LNFSKSYLFKILKKITKTVHYLGLTYGKFHCGIRKGSNFSSVGVAAEVRAVVLLVQERLV
jgi:hypothetical protein